MRQSNRLVNMGKWNIHTGQLIDSWHYKQDAYIYMKGISYLSWYFKYIYILKLYFPHLSSIGVLAVSYA